MLTKDLDKSLVIKVEESWIDSNRITRGGILGSGLFILNNFILLYLYLERSAMFFIICKG